jgi:hypothetical protein
MNPSYDPHRFYGYYTIFAPRTWKKRDKGEFMDVGSPTDFSETKKAFDTWLCDHVRTSIDEELLPDLWSTVSTTLIATNSSPRRRTAHFTDEERRQVKLALATFRVRLNRHLNQTKSSSTSFRNSWTI